MEHSDDIHASRDDERGDRPIAPSRTPAQRWTVPSGEDLMSARRIVVGMSGWAPRVGVEQGVARLLRWLEELAMTSAAVAVHAG